VINRTLSGNRCRIVRAVPALRGVLHRHTEGTIRYGMENLGRELVLVDWDTGEATMVFPQEIELVSAASASVPA